MSVVKPLPAICNRSESGGFFWEIGQYGDYRPLGKGDQGSKIIDALARERAAKLQRRREYYRERYAVMIPEQKAEYGRKCMEAGTVGRASAVSVLQGEFLADDRLCIFGCGQTTNAAQCRACKQCCLLHKEESWEGCNCTASSGLFSHRNR